MLLDTASNGERRVMGKGRAATYGSPGPARLLGHPRAPVT